MRTLFVLPCLLLLSSCDVAVPDLEFVPPIRYARIQLQSAQGLPDEVIVGLYNEEGLAGGATNDETITLAAGHSYDGRLLLFSSNPPAFETNETQAIVNGGPFHRVTYSTAVGSALTITPTDRDANGRPIGLTFRVVVRPGATGSETLRVRLARYTTAEKTEPPAIVMADFAVTVRFR